MSSYFVPERTSTPHNGLVAIDGDWLQSLVRRDGLSWQEQPPRVLGRAERRGYLLLIDLETGPMTGYRMQVDVDELRTWCITPFINITEDQRDTVEGTNRLIREVDSNSMAILPTDLVLEIPPISMPANQIADVEFGSGHRHKPEERQPRGVRVRRRRGS
jgi:hypothetical protein